MDFYPRSPRGERQFKIRALSQEENISIHAPREGSDMRARGTSSSILTFLSTLPARGATINITPAMQAETPISIHAPREGSDGQKPLQPGPADGISIHAPREGSDRTISGRGFAGVDFYPRSPRGERLGWQADGHPLAAISIHAPREGSDPVTGYGIWCGRLISIHAPREGSDARCWTIKPCVKPFLSTLPARGATLVCGFRAA